MNILFIDTHSNILTLSLYINGTYFTEQLESQKSHSEIAIPTLEKLLEKSKSKLDNINEIYVVNGPGSFTGVRIGVTIAKTLAYSLNIPIKQISSLEAYGISDCNEFDIITVKDNKGYYIANKINNKFANFTYMKTDIFEKFIKENNYIYSTNTKLDLDKIIEYMKDIDYINPHKVNPIYIKEIDALKW